MQSTFNLKDYNMKTQRKSSDFNKEVTALNDS